MGDAAYKQNHQERGLCVNCNEYALPYKTRCQKCNDNHNATMRNLNRKEQKERALLGLCPRCGGERTDEKKLCVNCREETSRRNRI